MKILHTSDWHIGQIFKGQTRDEEHRLFLNWLIEHLNTQSYDALIVAGDVFDVGNPSNQAKKIYFDFLLKASQSSLQHLIIIAGNHDYASTLEAPKELLATMNIHVVGRLGDDLEKSIVEINDSEGQSAKVFCAPYLRAGDLSTLEEGESIESVIKRSVSEVYRQGYELCRANGYEGICIATGHLYAAGSYLNDSVRAIQVGKEGPVGVESFGEGFDYVALGHIHKHQKVFAKENIRYSGSSIPLSFSEQKDQKVLLGLDFENGLNVQEIKIPEFRQLRVLKGTRADVRQAMIDLSQDKLSLGAWIEVELPEEAPDPQLAEELRLEANELGLTLFGVYMKKQIAGVKPHSNMRLEDLGPMDVFKIIIDKHPDQEELLQTFKELEQISSEEQE